MVYTLSCNDKRNTEIEARYWFDFGMSNFDKAVCAFKEQRVDKARKLTQKCVRVTHLAERLANDA